MLGIHGNVEIAEGEMRDFGRSKAAVGMLR